MPQTLTFDIGEAPQEIWVSSSETTNFTITATGTVFLVDASSAAVTATLPAAATYPDRMITVKKVDSSTNSVTVDGNGSETIDGSTTQVITTQYVSITMISDGSEWFIL